MGTSYLERRGQIENYFDRTAADAWARLTSDAPVSRIRATVRAGRDRMRNTLLEWLPEDMTGLRLLDAGCGTGALAVAAAERGADVLAIDLSPTLVGLARERVPSRIGGGRIEFAVGDMSDPALGDFDYMVAMDSLIHYRAGDVVALLSGLAPRTRRGMLFTFAPSTPALALMHAVGRLFPRGNRAPAIEPVREHALHCQLSRHPGLGEWRIGRNRLVSAGFYISQAQELAKA